MKSEKNIDLGTRMRITIDFHKNLGQQEHDK